MIHRRELLTFAGLLGGLPPGANAADGAAAATGEISDRSAEDIVNAIKAMTAAVTAARSFDAINPIRLRQMDYLKATNKFPDFIDISPDVWTSVYDWHVRMGQPLMLGRDAGGRYTMTFGFTQLVLRADVAANFISVPYDAR